MAERPEGGTTPPAVAPRQRQRLCFVCSKACAGERPDCCKARWPCAAERISLINQSNIWSMI